jgi:hypothetical protein
MGTGRSKPIHIGVGEAHAVTKHNIHGAHHEHHTGLEGVVHNVQDWSNELFSKRVQEGDTLWYLSEKYLGDGNKWPYLQSACDLDRDPHHLLPGRPITHHCINKAKEEAKHHHYINPSSNPLHRHSHGSSSSSEHTHSHEYVAPSKNPLHRVSVL